MSDDVKLNTGFGNYAEKEFAEYMKTRMRRGSAIWPMPDVKFPLESVVYLKHRDICNPGIVNGILFQSSGVEYRVAWPHLDGTAKWHQSIELSSEYEPNYS